MKTITYNLRGLNGSSNEYYWTIHEFSETVFNRITNQPGDVIDELITHVIKNEIEKPRSEAEYAVEILTLGMTWDRYFGASQRTSKLMVALLAFLYKLAKKWENSEKVGLVAVACLLNLVPGGYEMHPSCRTIASCGINIKIFIALVHFFYLFFSFLFFVATRKDSCSGRG